MIDFLCWNSIERATRIEMQRMADIENLLTLEQQSNMQSLGQN